MDPRLTAVLARLCQRLGPLFTTQAVKLPYLVDVIAKHVLGRPIADGTYQTWEHGVVTREVFRFIRQGAPEGAIFCVRSHEYSESAKQILLAGDPAPEVIGRTLTLDEIAIVDFVADEYGHIQAEQLGYLTKRLNTEIDPDQWGSNHKAAVNEEAFLRLNPAWQSLCERIGAENLDDRSRWSEPINADPMSHFRQLLNG
jgi:uncharacterized phage-associated protein